MLARGNSGHGSFLNSTCVSFSRPGGGRTELPWEYHWQRIKKSKKTETRRFSIPCMINSNFSMDSHSLTYFIDLLKHIFFQQNNISSCIEETTTRGSNELFILCIHRHARIFVRCTQLHNLEKGSAAFQRLN